MLTRFFIPPDRVWTMHAGMVGRTAIEKMARLPAFTQIASEFRYSDPILRNRKKTVY